MLLTVIFTPNEFITLEIVTIPEVKHILPQETLDLSSNIKNSSRKLIQHLGQSGELDPAKYHLRKQQNTIEKPYCNLNPVIKQH